MAYYYAQLDLKDICVSISTLENTIEDNWLIPIDSADESLIGLWYDRTDSTFKEAPITVLSDMSTDQINYKDQNVWLNDVLDGKAAASHTHSDYALSAHTHADYALASHTHNYTHMELKPATGTTNGGYIDFHYSGSTDDYTARIIEGAEGRIDVLADNGFRCNSKNIVRSVNNVDADAAGNVDLSLNFLPLAGGTVTGEVNFSGGLVRVKGHQTFYATDTRMTLGTNNLETYIVGSSIISRSAITVASDARLKENIVDVDVARACEFISKLRIREYNYIGADKKRVGVIAQEVQAISDFAEHFVEKKDDYLNVSFSELVFPLIAAVQKLQQRVEELEKKGV